MILQKLTMDVFKSRILIGAFGVSALFAGCTSTIKNDGKDVEVENGTETTLSVDKAPPVPANANPLYGFWVGMFDEDINAQPENLDETIDEMDYYSTSNKINISIDQINGNKVEGHTVVAGNQRPFSGTYEFKDGIHYFEASEPGDDKFDGQFKFYIKHDTLFGKWKSFKKIKVSSRTYALVKRNFKYDPNIALEEDKETFVDWMKTKNVKIKEEETEYFITEYASATNKIYTINASNTELTKEQVANLKRGDIYIIRNTIYARHGYSFKKKPLRQFFDFQDWYIPVYADIKTDLTEIEKKNIELLLRYEKNAAEYYDTFGR